MYTVQYFTGQIHTAVWTRFKKSVLTCEIFHRNKNMSKRTIVEEKVRPLPQPKKSASKKRTTTTKRPLQSVDYGYSYEYYDTDVVKIPDLLKEKTDLIENIKKSTVDSAMLKINSSLEDAMSKRNSTVEDAMSKSNSSLEDAMSKRNVTFEDTMSKIPDVLEEGRGQLTQDKLILNLIDDLSQLDNITTDSNDE